MRQSEISRRREHEVQKLKKDVELMAVQYESSEAGLRKRHQDAVNDLTDQLEQSNKQRSKSVPAPTGSVVVRIDPLRLLAGCRTRRLNQALSSFVTNICFQCGCCAVN